MEYQTPEILASFEIGEIVEEAAVCTGGYDVQVLD
jgi:hypothetical protein